MSAMAFIAGNFADYFCIINNLSELNFVDVLDAVEYHDDKEYKNSGV